MTPSVESAWKEAIKIATNVMLEVNARNFCLASQSVAKVIMDKMESRLKELKSEPESVCVWKEDGEGVFATTCKHCFWFDDGEIPPDFKTRPYCATPIKIERGE